MSVVLAISQNFEDVACCNCGILFAVPQSFYRVHLRDKKQTFYCPNGHSNWYPGKTDAEKLREELAAEKLRTQAALSRENTERAAREKAERKLKRVSKGTCPCCRRSFANVRRHMLTKHPEEVAS